MLYAIANADGTINCSFVNDREARDDTLAYYGEMGWEGYPVVIFESEDEADEVTAKDYPGSPPHPDIMSPEMEAAWDEEMREFLAR